MGISNLLQKGNFRLVSHLQMCYKINRVLKAGYLMLGVLSNHSKSAREQLLGFKGCFYQQ